MKTLKDKVKVHHGYDNIGGEIISYDFTEKQLNAYVKEIAKKAFRAGDAWRFSPKANPNFSKWWNKFLKLL